MRFTRSQIVIIPLLIVLDIFSIYLSFYFAYNLRFFSFLATYLPITKGIPPWAFYKYALYFILPLFVFIFFKNDFYKVYFQPSIDELIRVGRSATTGIFLLLMTTFFYREFSYSRLTFVLFWVVLIAFVFLYREIFKFLVRNFLWSINGRENVLVVGSENKLLKALLKNHPHFQVLYYPYKEQDIEQIKQVVIDKNINQMIITNHGWPEKKMLEVYDWCENRQVEMKFVPDLVQMCKGEICIDSSLGLPLFHLRSISLSGLNFYFKRIIDLIVAISVMSFIWPVLLMIALLIKIDSSGPFLYKHKRMGYRGKTFEFFKFRTMVVNADALLEKFKAMSERKGPVFKMSNDPRVTRIGKFLRRYSIDEIPQLINVIKGDMSLVGPRPQVLWEASAYDDWAKRRLRATPWGRS
jgi:exopolysaccharide biosynthesis polyprenyl glycosylphosphotransferase